MKNTEDRLGVEARNQQMSDDRLESDTRMLREAQAKGGGAKVKTYLKLSGPGWLQSAITLGGGSLTGSLYLGVLAGFTMLWLQPIAMIFGIIMLSAIGYVTMSTGRRPFEAINTHINPVLGWGWALASLMASMVWALPQYSLATGVLQQNLFPGILGAESALGDFRAKLVIVICILLATTAVTWSYGSGSRGVKLYEMMLKLMVAVIVLCFFGVVVKMSLSEQGLNWAGVFAGFLPDLRSIFRPAASFQPLLEAVSPEHREYWSQLIVAKQRDVMMTAAATAVGINMTFLFPYSILARRWGKEFRGLSRFDLSTGMLIPFVLATSCVIIAAATQFHTVAQPGILNEQGSTAGATASRRQLNEYEGLLKERVAQELNAPLADMSAEDLTARMEGLNVTEKRLAATLVTRDAFDLAQSIKPFTGDLFGNIIFGIGVLGMTLSTITILMLISGFVICEMLGVASTGWPHRLGTLAATTGALGPFLWSKAAFWLAIPTSIFGLILLPIAYWTFFLLMNSKALLGKEMPRGRSRVIWNTLMVSAATIATFASLSMVWIKTGYKGMIAIAIFLLAVGVVHFLRKQGKGVEGE